MTKEKKALFSPTRYQGNSKPNQDNWVGRSKEMR